ncbi:hypothetical protein [Thiomonas sp.]|jgi:hypothetical protein|uniref:hypothetical protein n=1 Tax=Thiomonas sp. TaxID=2047785 RepID=UPI0025864925|nr:hypothetical protein [Thiomonas sp.]
MTPRTDADERLLAAAYRLHLRRPEDVLNPEHTVLRVAVRLADAALSRIHAERARLAAQCGKQRACGD